MGKQELTIMPGSKFVLLFVSVVLLFVSSSAEAQRWGRGARPGVGVCFYRDADFKGDYFCAKAGETLAAIPKGTSDRVGSIQMLGRVGLTLFAEPNFKGASATFAASVPNLKNGGYNNLVSSIQVRQRPNPQEADRIVRRAYKELLARAPDAEGLKNAISRLVDAGWSEAQIREEFIKSDEYRRLSSPGR